MVGGGQYYEARGAGERGCCSLALWERVRQSASSPRFPCASSELPQEADQTPQILPHLGQRDALARRVGLPLIHI